MYNIYLKKDIKIISKLSKNNLYKYSKKFYQKIFIKVSIKLIKIIYKRLHLFIRSFTYE